MRSLEEVRTAFLKKFGPETEVVHGLTTDGSIYVFGIEVTPRESSASTEQLAWDTFVNAVHWITSEEQLLGAAIKVEIIVALPKSFRQTKRRIFRVGGSLKELTKIASTSNRTDVTGSSYVVKYSEWKKDTNIWE